MAVTVTTDLVVRHAMDSVDGTTQTGIGGIGAPNAADTAIKVQGTASGRPPAVGASLGGVGGSFTAADISKLHIFCWVNDLDKSDTLANNGWRIRIASNLAGLNSTPAFGEWTVGGQDTYIAPISGFQRWCIDVNRPFDFITGTPPALSSVGGIGLASSHLTNSSRATWFSDSYDTATGITITGGTGADPGTSTNIAADDLTNGRGIFKDVGGIYYILGRLTFGDTTAGNNFTFLDKNEVWNFENQRVSATFHKIVFVGNATGTTKNITFGSKSGTGTTAEGAGGNSVKAAGASPFRIEAIDSNVTVGLYGCSFTNPVALKDDALRAFVVEDNSLTSFVNDTRDANNSTANDAAFFPASPAVNDAPYFGHEEIFSQLKINVGTAGTGTYTVTWQYWNGSSWASLTNVTDGTTNFKTAGTNTVTYSIPNDWATTTIGGLGAYYYIRALRDGGTNTVSPLGTQMFCVMGGRVRWEQANAEAIRCTFTNMDTIKVRNGAFLKKCVITNSVAPAKSAALDLGASDPTADTVRDLTIQNCINGVLLNPTGTTTYNFRAIKFSNNTNDVRVDAPGASTITINILEGGTTPTTQNVNGSTIVINNSVTLTVTVKDEAGVAISGAQVGIFKTSDNTQLMNEATIADGTATETFNFVSNVPVNVRVRKGTGGGASKYVPVESPQTITSAGLTVTITLVEDTINTL